MAPAASDLAAVAAGAPGAGAALAALGDAVSAAVDGGACVR